MEKAFRISLEMITQRNYEILSTEDIDQTQSLQCLCKCKNNEIDVYIIAVYETYNTNILKRIIQLLNNENVNHSIVIYNQDITSFVKSQNIIAENNITLENFSKDELTINITKHMFQPSEIVKLTPDEVSRIKKYKSKLPIILKTDPLCKFFNFPQGAVLKITRRDNSVCLKTVK